MTAFYFDSLQDKPTKDFQEVINMYVSSFIFAWIKYSWLKGILIFLNFIGRAFRIYSSQQKKAYKKDLNWVCVEVR